VLEMLKEEPLIRRQKAGAAEMFSEADSTKFEALLQLGPPAGGCLANRAPQPPLYSTTLHTSTLVPMAPLGDNPGLCRSLFALSVAFKTSVQFVTVFF